MSAETNNNDLITPIELQPNAAGASLSPLNKLWVMLTPKVLKVIIIVLASTVIVGTAVIIFIVVKEVAFMAVTAPINGTSVRPQSPTSTVSSTSSSSSSSSSTSTLSSSSSSTSSSAAPNVTESTTTTTSTISSSSSTVTPETTSTTSSTTPTISTPTPTTPSTTTSTTTTSTTATTTTTAVVTTTLQECLDSEFLCGSGECIPWKQLCDGLPQCTDGSDEGIDCVCGQEQWKCSSGQCVALDARCDGVVHCLDSSDEMMCPECSGFQCDTGLCLWDDNFRRCDGVFDCTDLSDEVGCSPRAGTRLCENRVRIPQSQWCDGVDHCGDNSDETNCRACRGLRVACPDGTCIMRHWRCDGYSDCQNGTDEIGCGDCKPTQIMCDNYQCIELSSVCDGDWDCKRGEDELHCFSAQDVDQGLLWARYQGRNHAVCSDQWTTDFAVRICSDIDQLQLAGWKEVIPPPSVTDFVAFANISLTAQTTNLEKRSRCESGKVISITCQAQDCGERKVAFLQSFVAGGQIVSPGKWPWMVSLLYLGRPICGGTLINNHWLVTAAHCILRAVEGDYNLTSTPFYFDVILGSTHKLGQSRVGTPYRIRVSKIVLHPDLRRFTFGGFDWDVALVKLAVPVDYSPYIQPLCLPHQGQTLQPTALCYVAGWGLMNSQQLLTPEYMRDARMQVWSDRRCGRTKIDEATLVSTNSTLCGGSTIGDPEACQGDSGGPLMCLSISGRWMLAGVMIRGSTPCGLYQPRKQANQFARIANAAQWIRHITEET